MSGGSILDLVEDADASGVFACTWTLRKQLQSPCSPKDSLSRQVMLRCSVLGHLQFLVRHLHTWHLVILVGTEVLGKVRHYAHYHVTIVKSFKCFNQALQPPSSYQYTYFLDKFI